MNTAPSRYAGSASLLERARQLIPGCHHLSGRPLVEDGPMYLERGRGCRVWDVDGNEYIDYLMAFGPFLLGYARQEVDEAAIRQLRQGKLLSMNHPLHLEFVERLLARFAGADMGIFLKTGSEATTVALRLARRFTGRRKVARCGYHGWHDWCLPLEKYVPEGLDQQVLEFRAEQPETLQRILEQHPRQIAAVIISPEMVLSPQSAQFLQLQAMASEAGAVFILDEVKTAFRTRPGSLQQYLGIQPDLTTLSKALGNGWPVAAVVGRRDVMAAGAGMHYSATFHGDSASLAAALKVLDILDQEPVADHVWCMGQRLIDGLNRLAQAAGVSARAYGEPLPPMPFLQFENPEAEKREKQKAAFYTHLLSAGILMHPRHMWFISQAHGQAEIDATLAAAKNAFEQAAQA
jgi:glutamate-1-semialdehyde 2,1-aminomutase